MENEQAQKEYRERFRGFRGPNTTQVPDEFFDEVLSILSGAEVKVALYIIRRTFGFKRERDSISISQMIHGITTRDGRILDRGTGLSRDSVTKALKALEEKGIILKNKYQSAQKGYETNTYSLNVLPLSENRTTPSPKMMHPLVRKSDIQDTVKQYTDNNVNVDKEGKERIGAEEPKTDLHKLSNLDQSPEKTNYIAEDILKAFGDERSKPFYHLVAAKIPESVIRQKLSELKQGNLQSPAKVFVSSIKNYVTEMLQKQKMQGLYSEQYKSIGKLPFR